MKNFFSSFSGTRTSILIALFIAASLFASFPHSTFAQTANGTGGLAGFVNDLSNTPAPTLDDLKNVDVGDDSSKSFLQTAGDAAKGIGATAIPSFFGVLYDASREVLAIASYFVFQLANLILGFAGVAFNYAVVYLVFQFGTTLGNSPGMLVAWGVLRDFSNIIFLFGFIFMGVITILDLHSYPVQKTLPKFLIAAILINFSLLGVSAVIDMSNVLAAAMYNQSMGTEGACVGITTVGGVSGGVGTQACKERNALNVGIAGKIMEVSRTSTVLSGGMDIVGTTGFFFSPNNSTATTSNPIQGTINALTNDKTKLTLALFMLAMFVITAAIVLMAGTVLLVGRAITLALLLVASPILVIGMVVPPLKKQAEQYWTTLLNNAIFAPVFLLLIFVSLKIAEGVENSLGTSTNLVDAFTKGDVSLMGGVMVFMLIIGFLIASLIAAKQFSIRFADGVNKAALGGLTLAGDTLWNTGTLPSRLVGAAVGGAAGRAARRLRVLDDGKFAAGVFGKPLVRTLGGVEKATDFKLFPKGGIVSKLAAKPLAGALGVGGGGGHGGGGAGHGAGDGHAEEGDTYLKELTDADKIKLKSIDGSKKAAEDQLKVVDEQIKNAEYAGRTGEVARLQGTKADLKKKIEELDTKKRDLVLTKTQKETYARLQAEGKDKADEYVAGIEQARREQGALETTLPGLDNEIAVLQERLANPEYQGEEQQRDIAHLNDLRERAAKTRSAIAEKAATVVRLQSELDKHNNDSTANLAKYVATAADEYKERRVREYANSQERFANSLYAKINPFISADKIHDIEHAVAKLRSEGLKTGVERGWDHLKHEIQHAAEHTAEAKLSPELHAAEERAAAAEERVHALESAIKTNGGGAPAGGGDHGGGH